MKNPDSHWPITFICILVFGLVGFAIGCSTDTDNPSDRAGDILAPTMILSIMGTLTGYLFSLVYYRRLAWFDGLAAISIPFLAIYGFWRGKSGDWSTFRLFNNIVLMLLGYLVVRWWVSSNTSAKQSVEPVEEPPDNKAMH